MMIKTTKKMLQFPPLKSKKIEFDFEGGNISSFGGAIFLREIDRKLALTKSAAKYIGDPRRKNSINHSILTMLRQRVYGIAIAQEDLNDHDHLRKDPLFQTILDQDKELGSSSTLCRFERYSDRKTAVGFHKVLIEQFIKSFKKTPKKLILDFDATDNPVYGNQEGRFFHGYYDSYCFLPLYVFCGKQLLVSYLRQSNQDGATHTWAILSLLVKRLRAQWPDVKIIFRADSGFCRHKIFNWCEKNDVQYIVGLSRNNILKTEGQFWIDKAKCLNLPRILQQHCHG